MVSPFFLIFCFSLVFGACIGSFLNVCIFRIPQEKSIVFPGSSCPVCGNAIRFYDNIPVLSYIFLGGKCRRCKTNISLRYPLIEILTALVTGAVFLRFGIGPQAGVLLALIYTLIVISFIDLDHQIIPDIISLPGIVLFGALAHWVLGKSFLNIGLGILAGGGLLYGVTLFYYLVRRIQGMGGGDIKLLAMLGAVLGPEGALFTIFSAAFLGAFVGLGLMVSHGEFNSRLKIPFGPFISLGSVFYVFWGKEILGWYLGILPL